MTARPRKNHFDPDMVFQADKRNEIISDRFQKVTKQKFVYLINLYLKNAYENGYNSALAFRVISLYLYCNFKPVTLDDDQGLEDYEAKLQSFNLVEEVNRFMDHELKKGQFSNIRLCMDLLLLKPLEQQVASKYTQFWKIRVLAALKKHYSDNHMKKEKKKASFAMRELCKEQLKKQAIKSSSDMYSTILDILVEEEKAIMYSKKSHGKLFQALQNATNIIRILEKAEQFIISKYQKQLMLAYWETAMLHNDLHYVNYAKKYCETVINIADRLNDKQVGNAARSMLENLTINR